jgi:hypothetical protein
MATDISKEFSEREAAIQNLVECWHATGTAVRAGHKAASDQMLDARNMAERALDAAIDRLTNAQAALRAVINRKRGPHVSLEIQAATKVLQSGQS